MTYGRRKYRVTQSVILLYNFENVTSIWGIFLLKSVFKWFPQFKFYIYLRTGMDPGQKLEGCNNVLGGML